MFAVKPNKCLICGYCLKGTISEKCSECGSVIQTQASIVPRISYYLILFTVITSCVVSAWYLLGVAAMRMIPFSSSTISVIDAVQAVASTHISNWEISLADGVLLSIMLMMPVALWSLRRRRYAAMLLIVACLAGSIYLIGGIAPWTLSIVMALVTTPVAMLGMLTGEDWAEGWIRYQAIGWWILLWTLVTAVLGIRVLRTLHEREEYLTCSERDRSESETP
jgi:hypothetical protein